MRRPHCNSISLGYMKPSTPGITVVSSSHRTVQVFVIELGSGGHVGLQNLHLVVAQKFVHGVLGVLEIGQLARAGRAVFAAGGSEALGDAVVAERALIHRFGIGMQVAAAVRAGLHAVTAAEAVVRVHQHHAIGADEGGAHGADLHAGGMFALVAELGDEEALEAGVDRKSTRLNSSHLGISYAVFCLKKKKINIYILEKHMSQFRTFRSYITNFSI